MPRNRLAQRIHDVPPSGIRRFFDIAAQMQDVVSLGIGEPDFVTPAHIRDAAIDSIRAGKTAYTSNSGLLELRQAIATHIMAHTGVQYDPEEEILVTVGVSEALQQAMLALINPGDEVIIPEPCFVAYPHTCRQRLCRRSCGDCSRNYPPYQSYSDWVPQ
jgi:aminotransferase